MKRKIIHKNGRVQVITDFVTEDGELEKTKTQQHHKDAHDINNIMKKYQKVGIGYNQLPPSSKGVYGDFSKTKTYQESVQLAIDAQNSFMTLPSQVRKRFQNDPQQLFDFLNDKNNYDEAVKLGLIEKKSDATPPTPPIPPTDS